MDTWPLRYTHRVITLPKNCQFPLPVSSFIALTQPTQTMSYTYGRAVAEINKL